MGGAFYIRPIGSSSEEFVENYIASWEWSNWYFHFMKGVILRGGIAYLNDLLKRDLTKDLLVKEGLVSNSSMEEANIVLHTRFRIHEALIDLESWKREPRADIPSIRPDFMALMHNAAMTGTVPDFADMLDAPYYPNKVARFGCPNVLEQLNLQGLYVLMALPDTNLNISYEQAQQLVFMLDKVDMFCDWKGQLCGEEEPVPRDDEAEDEERDEGAGGSTKKGGRVKKEKPPPLSTSQSLKRFFAKCTKAHKITDYS